jgi:hypothetical protein
VVKQPGCEVDPSPPFIVEVKKAWSYTATPPVKFKSRVQKISYLRSVKGKSRMYEISRTIRISLPMGDNGEKL